MVPDRITTQRFSRTEAGLLHRAASESPSHEDHLPKGILTSTPMASNEKLSSTTKAPRVSGGFMDEVRSNSFL